MLSLGRFRFSANHMLILAGHDLHPWENHLRLSRERQSSTRKNIHSAALGHFE